MSAEKLVFYFFQNYKQLSLWEMVSVGGCNPHFSDSWCWTSFPIPIPISPIPIYTFLYHYYFSYHSLVAKFVCSQFIALFCGAKKQIKGLMHAKKVLYYQPIPSLLEVSKEMWVTQIYCSVSKLFWLWNYFRYSQFQINLRNGFSVSGGKGHWKSNGFDSGALCGTDP